MNQGRESFRRGDIEEAIAKWTEASRGYESARKPQQQVLALSDLSAAYESLGRYGQAMMTLETAVRVAKDCRDRPSLTLAQSSLGRVFTLMRRTGLAEVCLRESLARAREDKDSPTVAVILNNLGNLLTALERETEALEAYHECLALATKAGKNLLAAEAGANTACLLLTSDKRLEAKQWNDTALQMAASVPSSHDAAYLLTTIGHTYRDIAEKDEASRSSLLNCAAETYQTALRLATDLEDQRALSFALGYLGEVYELEGRYAEALRLTRRARFIAQQTQLPQLLYLWQWQMGRLFKAQGKAEEAIANYRNAVQTLQSLACDLAVGYGNRSLYASFRNTISPVYFQLADLLLQQADTLRDPRLIQRNLVEARDTVELLKTAELNDYFQDDCVTAGLAKVKDVSALLKETAAVYYIPLSDRTEILLNLPSGMERFKVPVNAKALNAKVRRFRLHVERPTSDQYLPYAREIYDWLIRPMQETLQAHLVKTLVFVPDGALRTIPFAALHDGNQFLIEKFCVAIAPGLTLMDPRPLERHNVRVLAGGVSEAVQGFDPLEHVVNELKDIQRSYPATPLLNKQFLNLAFARDMSEGEYSVVHLASHGKFSGDPNKTYVLTYDSRLSLNDLESMIRPHQYRGTPVELLVLSACQTAAGDDRAALGLAGVAIKAGARSALATLWSVSDEASAQLTPDFYEALKENPSISRAAALQKAQLKLLRGERFQHPAYWSPYLLIGNWL